MQLSKRALWVTITLIFLTLVLFVGIRLYEKGYRLGLPTVLIAPGYIEVRHYDPTTQLYLNEEPLSGIPETTQTLRIPVPVGLHQLTVSREGYYPWQKTVDVGARETVIVAPFAVPSSTSGEVLPKTDKEYKPALAAIASTTLPTQEKPLYSGDTSMSVYLKDSSLIAKIAEGGTPPQYFCETECKNEHTVLTLEAQVRGVAFAPGRNDVLYIAVGKSIFAVEIDTRGTQNFEPIYEGIRPSFGIGPGYLYVADGESVFVVSLTPKL